MRRHIIALILTGLFLNASWAATPIDLRKHPINLTHASLGPQTSLKRTRTETDATQTTHVHLEQTYQGYKVWGAEAIQHTAKKNKFHQALSTMNGTIYNNIQADLKNTPATIFSAQTAEQTLQQTIQNYKQKNPNIQTLTDQKNQLMVYIDDNKMSHWVYYIQFMATFVDKIPAKPNFIIDAQTNTVYEEWNDIETYDHSNGGGFGGNFKTGQYSYDSLSTFPELEIERDPITQICYLENDEVIVRDRRDRDNVVQFPCPATSSDHNNIFWDADFDAINGGYSPSNDVLYAGKIIKAMYRDWYNLNVLEENGKPIQLIMRVHETYQGKPLENAYWDGKQMTFGDGGAMFYPLTSLGVTAHEVSHGFTEKHSDLKYKRQSGAINEAFSDMAAQAAEFYTTGKNTWQIGSELTKARNQALRYMDEPTKDCGVTRPGNYCSISNAEDYYNGLDVHLSSGVFNKAFYLLSTSAGWDTKKAFDVMVQANRYHWTPNTSFDDAACGVISAAQELGYNTDMIARAFAQVDIDTSDC